MKRALGPTIYAIAWLFAFVALAQIELQDHILTRPLISSGTVQNTLTFGNLSLGTPGIITGSASAFTLGTGTIANLTVTGTTSGITQPPQTITLSGAVTGTGTGAITTTFGPIDPTLVTGTAATLGPNTFTDTQTIGQLTLGTTGAISLGNGGSITGTAASINTGTGGSVSTGGLTVTSGTTSILTTGTTSVIAAGVLIGGTGSAITFTDNTVSYATPLSTNANTVGTKAIVRMALTGPITLNAPTNGGAAQQIRYHLSAGTADRLITVGTSSAVGTAGIVMPQGIVFTGTISSTRVRVIELEKEGVSWLMLRNLEF